MISRGALRSSLIMALLAGGVLGRSQGVGATVGPPAGLPRMLFECDLAQNFMNCGMWIWNGRLYDSAWANGTVGQMSVGSSSPNALVIKRVDTTGVAAGLTGTYTGKWDGKQITDAKFSWSWHDKSMVFTWAAVPQEVPVTLSNTNSGSKLPTNWYPAPLTAYTVVGEVRSWRGTSTVDYRSLGLSPMGKFETKPFPGICGQPCNNNIEKVYLIAAIYADGAAFGDQGKIAEIMTERDREQRAYKSIALRICALAKQQLGVPEIVASLGKEYDPPAGRDAASVLAVHFAMEFLNRRATLGSDGQVITYRGCGPNSGMCRPHSQSDTDNTIEATLKEINQRRAGLLADPVKDQAGKLYLTDTADEVGCKLP
jgi:hypothetical protein